ncbi:hypothetical protein [Vibrio sp. Vb1574]|uniref:hypothetical protein n=1 Tax=Vibrio sp. Vb1574 TaxID=3074643 RepID=UPI0029652B4C|nr:hypothetical protein [Vibrio sp. Vb1574]MDW1888309.1 hypothetical protein [Vibrio sp. Vb1574]
MRVNTGGLTAIPKPIKAKKYRGKRVLDDELKEQIRKCLDVCMNQKDDHVIRKKSKRPSIAPRYTMRQLAKYSGLSLGLVERLLDGSSCHWSWLREEGYRPKPWLLRCSQHGTQRHLMKVGYAELDWRYEQRAVTKKEWKESKKRLRDALRPLLGLKDTKGVTYRTVLCKAYMSIQPWSLERLAEGQKRIEKKKRKGKRV